ncbi:hypothetical protein JY423_22290, partial [Stenotrophomonas maltophilia]|nr:hypothetical protein [Stenotrophomonas maltophilia]
SDPNLLPNPFRELRRRTGFVRNHAAEAQAPPLQHFRAVIPTQPNVIWVHKVRPQHAAISL